jgi:tetratricopeptide (TPR) repeat protein
VTDSETRQPRHIVCALLATAVLIIFSAALRCGFVNYDDPAYVTENVHVQHGLTASGFAWALTATAASNWHPLTWLSHMADCQLYGVKPLGHHLTSVLFHAANAVLLFLLLEHLTGAFWRSASVAMIFALHPLRVESVAWVSERKDVLSSFFGLLAIWAFVRYAENLKSEKGRHKFFYALALAFFALGLLAKPMLVTLPFVLLLLDYWPLHRLGRRAITEKIPFFVLSAACSFITFLVQNGAESVASLGRFSLGDRLANVPVSYVRYVLKNFWPSNLAAYYPYRPWPAWEVVGAIVLLAAVTALVLSRARSAQYLAVGWFWFLGMLVPVIGVVQVGGQSMADRYTYLSAVGLWIMVVWGIGDFVANRPRLREGVPALAALAAMAFAMLTWNQTSVYQNSGTLWEATLRAYPDCLPAHNNLSSWDIDQGRWDDALAQCRQTLAILPADAEAHDNLALIYMHQGNLDGAAAEASRSIQTQPHSAVNRLILARVELQKHDFPAAAASLRAAVEIDPNSAEGWCNLGFALLQQGQTSDAEIDYIRALMLNPDYALAHNDLGNILLRQGRIDEARERFQRAVELAPSFAEAHYNLAGVLAHLGRMDEAIAHCQKAVELQPNLGAARQRLTDLMRAKEGKNGP